jgi:hypothetical protein
LKNIIFKIPLIETEISFLKKKKSLLDKKKKKEKISISKEMCLLIYNGPPMELDSEQLAIVVGLGSENKLKAKVGPLIRVFNGPTSCIIT